MRSIGFLRRRSLRVRITVTFVAAAALLAVVLSLVTLVTVSRFLEEQRIRSSTRQTLFATLFAREFLATRADPEELVSKLQIRQRFDAMVTKDDEWFATSLELTPDAAPADLRSLVSRERFGYGFAVRGRERLLVYGTPLPPAGIDLYLFFSMEDIDRTISLMGRALAVSALILVAFMALFARRVSSRLLYPLAAVSGAAQQMAEGLLEARVEADSADELGQLAASFNRMAEALRDMIRHERDFVAAVSHELRSPLAALNAAREVVTRHRDRLPAEGREALDLINEDLVALQTLVEELMEVSELDSGRATVRAEEIRVRSFVEAVLRRKRLDAALEGTDPVVTTDKARLERIVGNLIDNAYAHGEGRDVRVRVAGDPGGCSIVVSDAGPGIAPDELSSLFRRFYKSDRSRTRERGGVGLGLAIAKENATLLGGDVRVSSTLGGGASFTVRLPPQVPEPKRVGEGVT